MRKVPMDSRKYCPECKQSLPVNKSYCNCGWKFAKTEIKQIADYQCQYRDAGVRCVNAGTISHATSGNKWYCISHYHLLRNNSIQRVSFANRYQLFKHEI